MSRPKKEATESTTETVEAPKLTPVKQVKLAVAIPGTTTQTLMEERYSLMYDSLRMVLYVYKKEAGKSHDKYIIFPPNIAYMKI
jgi:hypothetical protein